MRRPLLKNWSGGRETRGRSGLGVGARTARKRKRASAENCDGDAGWRKHCGRHEPQIGKQRKRSRPEPASMAEAIRPQIEAGRNLTKPGTNGQREM